MRFDLNISLDRHKVAKCKLLGNYKPLLGDSRLSCYKSSSDEVLVSLGNLTWVYDLDMQFRSMLVKCVEDRSSIVLTEEEVKFSIDGFGISVGVVHEFSILGYRVLVNTHKCVVFVCDGDLILSAYGTKAHILKVFEENNMICITTKGGKYLIDVENLETFNIQKF